MTKPKGRNKPTGGVGGRETKATKRAKTAAARDALALDRRSAKLEQERAALVAEMAQREQALRAKEQALRAKEAAFAKKEEAAARAAAQREKREQEEVERVEAAAAAAAEKVAQDHLDYIDTSVHEVKPKKGEVWTQLQSRMVLMLLFDLRKDGRSENEAVLQVARTFKIGHDKVRRINNHWWDHRQLYETTAAGRAKTAKEDDGRTPPHRSTSRSTSRVHQRRAQGRSSSLSPHGGRMDAQDLQHGAAVQPFGRRAAEKARLQASYIVKSASYLHPKTQAGPAVRQGETRY
ncbi:hypothetical protein Esi_0151_0059 [Ectocarpus siliculosus]|uniref:Uncharacterized protein n=1 Tax=Ectocarpus siliculosus TaxID=2880 RepID=D8LFT2_ECTSI|nr:hypothetical protein Esi_0151_0059 [Ectocarpus siliculosus]|eukprot:CBN75656.1 hypothetical protein Esi_0151_0059 [Ectocarpus siliculosus]